MTTNNRQNTENILFIIAFALALILRLIRLDALSLSNFEANWAMQALGLAQNARPLLDPQPAYILPTALLFFIFHSSDFLARLVPALAGSLIVLVPYLFRDRLPGWTAVVLAFILAFEPGLLAVSRLAGGPMLAVSFTLLGLGMWRRGYARWAGFFAALTLLSGPAVWPGLLGLITAALLSRGSLWLQPPVNETKATDGSPETQRKKSKQAFISGGITLLGAATLFLLSPNGLGSALGSLPDYLAGWGLAGDVPYWRLLISLSSFELLFIIFAVIAGVRGVLAGDKDVIFLIAWMLVALVFASIYPVRQVYDLVWMIVPLSTLAALEVGRWLVFDDPEGRLETLGVMVLTFSVLVFIGMNFIGLGNGVFPSQPVEIPLLNLSLSGQSLTVTLLVIAITLLVVSVLLVATGWSMVVAWRGAIWGLLLAMILYTISAATSASGIRANAVASPWRPDPQPAQQVLLLETVKQLSDQHFGVDAGLDIQVYNLDMPILRWTLRGQNVKFVSALSGAGDTPAIVIAPPDPNLPLPVKYRGQDFVISRTPIWNTALNTDWLRWLAVREMPADEVSAILWAREDVFLDSQMLQP